MMPLETADKIALGICQELERRMRAMGVATTAHYEAGRQLIEAGLRQYAGAMRERCAVACDRVYQRLGVAVRECDTHAEHEMFKQRAAGAGECAENIRALPLE